LFSKIITGILVCASLTFAGTPRSVQKSAIRHMLCEEYCEPWSVVVLDSGSALPKSYFIEGYEMSALSHSVRQIHKEYVYSGQAVSGIMVVRFTISCGGSVVNDTILYSTVKNQKFDADIRGEVRKNKWKEDDSGSTAVTFPLTFWKTRKDYEDDKYGIGESDPVSKGLADAGISGLPQRFDGPFDAKKSSELDILLNGHPTLNHEWKPGPAATPRRGSVTLDSVILESDAGIRAKGEVIQAFRSNTYPALQIYGEYLKQKSALGGKVTFRITIAENGRIVGIDRLSGTTGDSSFDTAVKNMVAAWRMEKRAVGISTWRITLNFSKSGRFGGPK